VCQSNECIPTVDAQMRLLHSVPAIINWEGFQLTYGMVSVLQFREGRLSLLDASKHAVLDIFRLYHTRVPDLDIIQT
jgi:hypothetical protein